MFFVMIAPGFSEPISSEPLARYNLDGWVENVLQVRVGKMAFIGGEPEMMPTQIGFSNQADEGEGQQPDQREHKAASHLARNLNGRCISQRLGDSAEIRQDPVRPVIDRL